jgi:hypothetical protein
MPKDNDRVFLSFGQAINTAGLIRDDLTAAGIPLIDKDGIEICFHSLRNSYISYLANSSTPAKVVQKLARHSDPRLTFNTYARTFGESEQKAVTFLPNFGNFVLSTCLDKSSIKQEISIDNQRQKTAFLLQEKLPPRGLEPLLLNQEILQQAFVNNILTEKPKAEDENNLAFCLALPDRNYTQTKKIIDECRELSECEKIKISNLIEEAEREAEIEYYEKRENDLKFALGLMVIASKNAAE